MKKKYTLLSLYFITIIGILLFYKSNNHLSDKESIVSALQKEYPSEWMYNQRAYPNNYINADAIKDAFQQSKSIVENRAVLTSDWTEIGPLNTGGRITDLAISPDNDDILYVTTPVGGVFKTIDRGENWIPIFNENGKPSIGNIAIAPSNSQRIYVGTGEANGSATSGAFFGDGMYRSDDGGGSWSSIGLEESNHIGRIVVDPTNQDRVFVAATGKLYGYNSDRGIYRTTNGGNEWEQVLFVTDSTAAIDVAINYNDTDIIFASMWERTRKPWQRSYGGETSAIHRSLDGGDTWEELGEINGLPAPDSQTGRIGIAISESEPTIIYARYTTNEITNEFNGLYKSIDNGDNWLLVTLNDLLGIDSSFGWYFGNIRINPEDAEEVYVLGQGISKTSNSGINWQSVSGMHVDHHALEYSRTNNDFILAGNDGGAYLSEDGGNSWFHFENLPITQFYNIDIDFQQPNRLYGGTQDNNTIRTLTAGTNDWNSIWGGDGFHVNVDPIDNNFIYVESQWGNLGRSINGGNSFSSATSGLDYDRTNWNTPVILSPFNSEIVYYGANKLYVSNRAELWSAISPDLTNGQHPSGSLAYGTITAIAASYTNLDVIYTGSDDGNLNVTFNGGATWENVSNNLPDRYITSLAISHSDDQVLYATFSGYGVLDETAHLFKTIDGGQNWSNISSNLPSIPINDVILHSSEDYIFIATDMNVWYSENDGVVWDVLGNDLPFTIIRDLKLHEPTNKLYAGTFGRSMHSYDLSNLILGSIENNLSISPISVFPNPARSYFKIYHQINSNGSIKLFNLNGKEIKTLFQGNFSESNTLNYSVEDLSSGVYFITINTGNQSVSKKLIVE